MRKQRAAIRYPGYVISNLPSRASIIPLTRRRIQRVVKLSWPNPDAKTEGGYTTQISFPIIAPATSIHIWFANLIQMHSHPAAVERVCWLGNSDNLNTHKACPSKILIIIFCISANIQWSGTSDIIYLLCLPFDTRLMSIIYYTIIL